MQNLGLSDSTPKTESRLKSLFWPSISSDVDVDYLTTQGFWVCTAIAAMTVLAAFLARSWAVSFSAFYYFLGAMGVRERSRFAALAMFISYALAGFVTMMLTRQGFSIIQILFLALLLANVRAVWLADAWRQTNQPDESPERMEDTLMDRISDKMPQAVWPVGRFVFYVAACLQVSGLLVALLMPARLASIR
jgi:hypothetical protein